MTNHCLFHLRYIFTVHLWTDVIVFTPSVLLVLVIILQTYFFLQTYVRHEQCELTRIEILRLEKIVFQPGVTDMFVKYKPR